MADDGEDDKDKGTIGALFPLAMVAAAVDKPAKGKDKGKDKDKKTHPKVRLVFNEEDAKAAFESFMGGPAKVGS